MHWYWKRFTSEDDDGVAIQQELLQIIKKRKGRASKRSSGSDTISSVTSQSLSKTPSSDLAVKTGSSRESPRCVCNQDLSSRQADN